LGFICFSSLVGSVLQRTSNVFTVTTLTFGFNFQSDPEFDSTQDPRHKS